MCKIIRLFTLTDTRDMGIFMTEPKSKKKTTPFLPTSSDNKFKRKTFTGKATTNLIFFNRFGFRSCVYIFSVSGDSIDDESPGVLATQSNTDYPYPLGYSVFIRKARLAKM